jgi:hypothetical protein
MFLQCKEISGCPVDILLHPDGLLLNAASNLSHCILTPLLCEAMIMFYVHILSY